VQWLNYSEVGGGTGTLHWAEFTVLHQQHSDEDRVCPYIDDLLQTGMSDYVTQIFLGVLECRFGAVERQLEVAERRAGPFLLNLTTGSVEPWFENTSVLCGGVCR